MLGVIIILRRGKVLVVGVLLGLMALCARVVIVSLLGCLTSASKNSRGDTGLPAEYDKTASAAPIW